MCYFSQSFVAVNCVCFRNELLTHVRDCVQLYTADWVVVSYQYRHLSSSSWVRDRGGERLNLVQAIPRQIFEVDYDQNPSLGYIEDVVCKVIFMSNYFCTACWILLTSFDQDYLGQKLPDNAVSCDC
jgi:hypothetical protein